MDAVLIPLLSHAGPWAVVLLSLIVFCESGILAGFFLPGDSLLFAAGVLVAAGVVHVPLVLVIAVCATAAFLGDQVGWLIGNRAGPKVLSRPNSRFLTPDHIGRAQAFFDRHGPRAVVLARFVPVVRTFTPVIAGVGRMPHGLFARYNLLGAVGWTTLMLGAGAVLGGVPLIAHHIEVFTVGMVALSLVPVVAAALRARATRARPEKTPATERSLVSKGV